MAREAMLFTPSAAPVFVSTLRVLLEQRLGSSTPVGELIRQIDGWVKANDLRRDELEWSGLSDWLRALDGLLPGARVSRQEVIDIVDSFEIPVEEVKKGFDSVALGPLQYIETKIDLSLREVQSHLEQLGIDDADVRQRMIDNYLAFIGNDKAPENSPFPELDAGAWRHLVIAAENQRVSESLKRNFRQDAPVFDNHVLRGGMGYQELLLKIPSGGTLAHQALDIASLRQEVEQLRTSLAAIEGTEDHSAIEARNELLIEKAKALAIAEASKMRGSIPAFKHPKHWNETGVVAHIRYKERVLPLTPLANLPVFNISAFAVEANAPAKADAEAAARGLLAEFEKTSDAFRCHLDQGDLGSLAGGAASDIQVVFSSATNAKQAAEWNGAGSVKRLQLPLHTRLLATSEVNGVTSYLIFSGDIPEKRVLFIEEIQSDWGQSGRALGFQGGQRPGFSVEPRASGGYGIRNHATGEVRGSYATESDARSANLVRDKEAPPPAPFVTSTEDWLSLAMKRMIRAAAERGYDYIAWTNGKQQMDRFSKVDLIQKMRWRRTGDKFEIDLTTASNGNASPVNRRQVYDVPQLQERFGLELARQILSVADTAERRQPGGFFEGLRMRAAELTNKGPRADREGFFELESAKGLRVGNIGLELFYDEVLPRVVRKLVRKLGDTDLVKLDMTAANEGLGGQIGFEMTDTMRRRALSGLPRYHRTWVDHERAGTQEQAKSSPEFLSWFGNSQVVDAAGKPLVVYHGSNAKFNAFDNSKALDGAHWFVADQSHAASFGDVRDFHLSIINPKIISDDDLYAEWDKAHPDGEQDEHNLLPRDFVDIFVAAAKAEGHDGLIIRDMGDRDINADMYLPFSPTQIKAASANNGQYDPKNPDIRYGFTPDDKLFAEVSAEKLKREIKFYGYSNGTTRGFITRMSIDDFLELTTPSDNATDRVATESAVFDATAFNAPNGFLPYLDIDPESGQVESHEGRHRAAALRAGGANDLPVIISFKQPFKNLPVTVLKGQWGRGAAVVGESAPLIAGGEAAALLAANRVAPAIQAVPAPPFFSALSRAIEQAPEKVFGGASQVKLWLLANKAKLSVKEAELQWSGVLDWLDLQQRVTKADVLDFLNGNGVQVQEVLKGVSETKLTAKKASDFSQSELEKFPGYEGIEPTDWLVFNDKKGWVGTYQNGAESDAEAVEAYRKESRDEGYDGVLTGGETKYGKYVLPGGENYRELLLTLPSREPARYVYQVVGAYPRDGFASREEAQAYINHVEISAKQPGLEGLQESINRFPFSINEYEAEESRKNSFFSSHWPETPNILAHIRYNDRTDAEGNKILFIEEIQSDWGQQGKKQGFNLEPLKKARHDELRQKWLDDTLTEAEGREFDDLGAQYRAGSVPRAPFVNKTEAWAGLAVKRMISYAAQNGYDKVAFINGEQSAARYDLSKHLSAVEYKRFPGGHGFLIADDKSGDTVIRNQAVTDETLEDYLGKDVAKRLMDAEPIDYGATLSYALTGIDLKVGGEGMRVFYDQILPQVVNDVLKKIGGRKVELVPIVASKAGNEWRFSVINQHGVSGRGGASMAEAKAEAARLNVRDGKGWEAVDSATAQPGFTITPEMRERVAGGLPLFMRSRKADNFPGMTTDLLRREIDNLFGYNFTQNLIDSGAFRLLQHEHDLPSHLLHPRGGIAGVYDDLTDKTYLVAEWIKPDMVKSMMLHEVGVHYGFNRLLGKRAQELFNQARELVRRGDPAAVEAFRKVPPDTPAAIVNEEILAYLVGDLANRKLSVVQQAVSRAKNFFFELGADIELTPADMTVLAEGCVKRCAAFGKRPTPSFLDRMSAMAKRVGSLATNPLPTRLKAPVVDLPFREEQALLTSRYRLAGRSEFDEWFEGSKITDAAGNPRIVYRGEWGGDPEASPFKNTKLGVPTFTDVPDIAQAYAMSPRIQSHYRNWNTSGVVEDEAPRVGMYYLALKNPIRFDQTDYADPFIEYGDLRAQLMPGQKVSEEAFNALISQFEWRYDGEEIELEKLTPEEREQAYFDSYRIIDSPQFISLAKTAGYDGVAYYGVFTSEDLFLRSEEEVTASTSYAGMHAWEVRPFDESQVMNAFAARAASASPAAPGCSPGPRYAFVGEKALTADRSLLAEAYRLSRPLSDEERVRYHNLEERYSSLADQEIEEYDALSLRVDVQFDQDLIRQRTGWFQGYDGQWRFELDDSGARLLQPMSQGGKMFRLDEFIDHPALFNAYPKLRGIRVFFDPEIPIVSGNRAYYDNLNGVIGLSPWNDNAEDIRSSLLHEIQHAVQYIEGFAVGGSISSFHLKSNAFDLFNAAHAEYLEVKATNPALVAAWEEVRDFKFRAAHAHGIALFDEACHTDENAYRKLFKVMTPEERAEHASLMAIYNAHLDDSDEVRRFTAALAQMHWASVDKHGVGGVKHVTAMEQYERLAGEIEARDVQARICLPDDPASPGASAGASPGTAGGSPEWDGVHAGLLPLAAHFGDQPARADAMPGQTRRTVVPYRSQGIPAEEVVVRFANGREAVRQEDAASNALAENLARLERNAILALQRDDLSAGPVYTALLDTYSNVQASLERRCLMGTVLLTPSAKSPNAWQVTWLGAGGEPVMDSVRDNYREAAEIFWSSAIPETDLQFSLDGELKIVRIQETPNAEATRLERAESALTI